MKDYSEIVIETHIPIPPPYTGNTRRGIICKMNIGDSIIVKLTDRRAWATTAKRMKASMISRMLLHDGRPNKDGYCRMWRTE
tara:strand:- start:1585 stop:1830 length:246 start_codon:yes stop_codon:yes gene_type:complete